MGKRIAGHNTLLSLCHGCVIAETLTFCKMAEKTLIPRPLCNSINETVKELRIISTY